MTRTAQGPSEIFPGAGSLAQPGPKASEPKAVEKSVESSEEPKKSKKKKKSEDSDKDD